MILCPISTAVQDICSLLSLVFALALVGRVAFTLCTPSTNDKGPNFIKGGAGVKNFKRREEGGRGGGNPILNIASGECPPAHARVSTGKAVTVYHT